jgi:HAD superfamily hydrolase (TIGR01490 family)
MNIAIYDLDKTITRRPTFTRFLLYYAQQTAPFRLAGLPIWIIALIGYRIGLYGRKPLKQFGISMFMGRYLDAAILAKVVANFVSEAVLTDIQPGAAKSIENDRSQSQKLVIATAAPAFYAHQIASRLSFDAVVATQHVTRPDGRICHCIDGENCYGPEKLKMVRTWFDVQGLKREDCHISVYSDHTSDAPLMDWADTAYLVNPTKKLRRLAAQKNWQIRDFSTDKGH